MFGVVPGTRRFEKNQEEEDSPAHGKAVIGVYSGVGVACPLAQLRRLD